MSISIGSWNINGITHSPDKVNRVFKTEEPDFLHYIKNHHIIGIIETKVSASEKIVIDGYVTEQIGRKISTNGRHYSGICIAIKESIASGVSVLKNKDESEYLWARLDKDYFNMNEDLYVGFVYGSPEKIGKDFGIEVYDRIVYDIANYCAKGKCMLFGDMHAHTNVNPDFINGDERNNDLLQLPDSYEPDIVLRRRNSDQRRVNEDGTALLDLCIESGLGIGLLNGRKLGNIFSKCTYFGSMCKETSLIDYGLTYKDDFKDITMFKVQDLCHLSDHCLVHAYITAQVSQHWNGSSRRVTGTLHKMPPKFIWEEKRRPLFLDKLSSPDSLKRIKDFMAPLGNTCNDNHNIDDIENASAAVSIIIISAAEQSLRKTKSITKGSKPGKKYAKHFDLDCKKLLKHEQKTVKGFQKTTT